MKLSIYLTLLGSLAAISPHTHATLAYTWTGTCDGQTDSCMGTASATLTLADSYTPGTALMLADFVRFEYTSSTGTLTVPHSLGLTGILGTLPNNPGTPSVDVRLDFTNGAGSTAAWFRQDGTFTLNCRQVECGTLFPGDNGEGRFNLERNAVPEPSTAALLALAIGLLFTLRRFLGRRNFGARRS